MSHYTQFVESETFESSYPTAPAVTDAMIDQMNADLMDVVRNDHAMGEAELELLAAQQEREVVAALAAKPVDRDETRVSVNAYKFKAEAKIAGGRWQNGGQYRKEADAWAGAKRLLVTLRTRALLSKSA